MNAKDSKLSKYQPAGKMAAKGSDQPKRNHSEVSNDSINDSTSIKLQLETMELTLTGLREELKQMLKKDDIENLITNTVSKIISEMEKRNEEFLTKIQQNIQTELENKLLKITEHSIKEKTNELADQIKCLQFENETLKENQAKLLKEHKTALENVNDRINSNTRLSEENSKRSNHNEQYSRKNNIKIMDVKEEPNESITTLSIKVTTLFQDQNIEIKPEQIVAIHRIPTKKGQIRPVLIKLRNNDDKSTVMRKRKEMKQSGHRLVDDVTALNTGLMSRLQLHKDIESTWFFNGSVFAKTKREDRIKFDLYDNIDTVIKEYSAKRK
ncbi:hypothetical protein DPMN_182617 [Dreissena polymorpha]|uniref:Uncharacterized protein n=1 Tax=Dreissena polymorpha TaxID=45954 RepID=A0A9D4I4U0_DREPO|nr:hypothetical protein DPMN_182617 [Dreissena polymorpha]